MVNPKRKLPSRQSLVQEVAEWLRGKINSGSFDGPLPSQRALRTQLQVGRSTIQAAFTLLRKEGIIHLQERKRATPNRTKHAARQNKIIWIEWDKKAHLSSRRHADILFFQTMIQQRGFDFELQISNPGSQAHRTRNHIKFLEWPNAYCCLLFNQPANLQQQLLNNNMRSIVIGSRAPDTSLPWINLNWCGVARHATGSALAKGHRKLALFCSKGKTPDHEDTIFGVKDTFSSHQNDPSFSLEIIRHDETRYGLIHSLRQLWKKGNERPTVIIVKEAYAMSTIYSTLLSQFSACIPQEISLICLEDDSTFSHINPSINAYGIGEQVLWRELVFAVTRIDRLKSSWRFDAQPFPINRETLMEII